MRMGLRLRGRMTAGGGDAMWLSARVMARVRVADKVRFLVTARRGYVRCDFLYRLLWRITILH